MGLALQQKIVHASTGRRREQWLSGIGVVELDRVLAPGLVHEGRHALEVAGKLSVVPIEVADAVRDLAVAVPPQLGLHRYRGRAVRLRGLVGRRVAVSWMDRGWCRFPGER